MDFMVSLPPLRGFDAIIVVMDRFSKMAHFIPTKESATAQEMGRLFFTHVFKHHGFPKEIVSNWDSKFTSKFLVSLVESHGVRAQDEHLILTPNEWTNRGSGLGYPTIPRKLCGNISTRLGGPFGLGQVFLQQFGAFGNMGHPLSNGDGQVTNYAYDLGCTWATLKWCEWGSVNGHILDEERWCLWKITKANLEKAHK